MTLLYMDSLFLEHDTGRHPENAGRLRSIESRLTASRLDAHCTRGTIQPLSEDAVTKIHTPQQLVRAKQLADHGGGSLDPDTVVSKQSFRVALAAAGAACSAVTNVVEGKNRNALCLIRPPGHHATPTRSMGFCLFNNIALAAHHARSVLGINRILIVDWDVHHGNGTQDIFYEDPQVFFFSIHRFGQGFYPGTGAANETGKGKGLGYTINMPIRHGTSLKEYHDSFRRALHAGANRIKPELVLVSAGFDAHRLDPIGSLDLETEDFAVLTREVLQVAETHAQGRLVSLLEGGYNPEALADSVQAHLEELLKVKA